MSIPGSAPRPATSAAFARDRLEAAVREYVKGGFQPHDIARLVSEIASELMGQKEWAESITPKAVSVSGQSNAATVHRA